MDVNWGELWEGALHLIPWLALCAATIFNTLSVRLLGRRIDEALMRIVIVPDQSEDGGEMPTRK